MKQEAEERVCILIVDDEKVMQESCARVFLKEGYHVSAADSGEEAIEK